MGYKCLRLLLKFETSLVTPLQSDTIFGEFCWNYRYLFGEGALEEFLKDYETSPSIIFSDGFPAGYLPVPKLPFKKALFSEELSGKENKEIYQSLKKFKKCKFIARDLLESVRGALSAEKLFELYRENPEAFLSSDGKRVKVLHVSIDRRTGTHREGALFQTEEVFLERGVELYVLYREDRGLSEEVIEMVFNVMGTLGIGAKKSVGKGKFSVKDIVEDNLLDLEGTRVFVCLSTGIPLEEEIEDYYAEFFTKFPKHGREFEDKAIFKSPVIFTRPGSVFFSKKKKPFYGKVLHLSVSKKHIHSGMIIPYFVGIGK